MKSLEQEFVELRTAVLASGKISAANVSEATRGAETYEQKLNNLKVLIEKHSVTVPIAESVSDKIASLTEKILASGKANVHQINESMAGCSSESERFDALQSLAMAKRIGMPRIVRNNGASMNESHTRSFAEMSEAERMPIIRRTMREMKMTEVQARIYHGLDGESISESTADHYDEKEAKQFQMLKDLKFSEADAKKIIAQGWY